MYVVLYKHFVIVLKYDQMLNVSLDLFRPCPHEPLLQLRHRLGKCRGGFYCKMCARTHERFLSGFCRVFLFVYKLATLVPFGTKLAPRKKQKETLASLFVVDIEIEP